MSTAENKAMVRHAYEGFNKGAFDGLYASDYSYHGPGASGDMDLVTMKQMARAFLAAFPDQHFALEDLFAEGDRVASRYTFRGTHQGEFMGVPATGREVTFAGVVISRFADGKWAEDWESLDVVGLMQQLGAPAPAPATAARAEDAG